DGRQEDGVEATVEDLGHRLSPPRKWRLWPHRQVGVAAEQVPRREADTATTHVRDREGALAEVVAVSSAATTFSEMTERRPEKNGRRGNYFGLGKHRRRQGTGDRGQENGDAHESRSFRGRLPAVSCLLSPVSCDEGRSALLELRDAVDRLLDVVAQVAGQ